MQSSITSRIHSKVLCFSLVFMLFSGAGFLIGESTSPAPACANVSSSNVILTGDEDDDDDELPPPPCNQCAFTGYSSCGMAYCYYYYAD